MIRRNCDLIEPINVSYFLVRLFASWELNCVNNFSSVNCKFLFGRGRIIKWPAICACNKYLILTCSRIFYTDVLLQRYTFEIDFYRLICYCLTPHVGNEPLSVKRTSRIIRPGLFLLPNLCKVMSKLLLFSTNA